MVSQRSIRNVQARDSLEKLLADPDFQVVARWNSDINPLGIIGIKERLHSKMLAWLANPREAHGLGAAVLRSLVLAAYNSPLREMCGDIDTLLRSWRPSAIHAFGFESAVVETEFHLGDGYLDILIVDRINGFAVAIENKHGARLANNQLERYKDKLSVMLDSYDIFYFVLDFYEKSDDAIEHGWLPLGYSWLSDLLRNEVENPRLPSRSRLVLKNYLEILDEDYNLNSEVYYTGVEKAAVGLAGRYPEAVDYLSENSDRLWDWGIWKERLNEDLEDYDYLQTAVLINEEALVLICSYSKWYYISQQLEKHFPGDLVEVHKSSVCVFFSEWKVFLDRLDDEWPFYLVVSDCDNIGAQRPDAIKTNKKAFNAAVVTHPSIASEECKAYLKKYGRITKMLDQNGLSSFEVRDGSNPTEDIVLIVNKIRALMQ